LEVNDVMSFIRRATVPYTPNPGWNISAIMTLGGFFLLAASAILCQIGYGTIPPIIDEIGKAAFYAGIGRASVEEKK